MTIPKLPTFQNQTNNVSRRELFLTLINFGIGVYNAYSNNRQEQRQTKYEGRQQEILNILGEMKDANTK